MSDPWGDTSDSEDSGQQQEEEDPQQLTSGFPEQLEVAIDLEKIEDLPLATLRNGMEKIEDVELLKLAYELDERENAREIYKRRLYDLDAVPPQGDHEQSSLEEVEELSESEKETDDGSDGEDEKETEEEDQSSGEDPEDETEGTDDQEDDDTMSDNVSVTDLASGAMSPEEAASKEHLWRTLVWGPPGVGKTHYAYTSPEPVCIIDTEGKAHDIAHKFQDKEFAVWQPEDYDEAKEALHEALDALDEIKEQTGNTGTIVVDSMSVMWGWAQQKYVDKYYPGKDVEDVQFTSGFGGGESDWKKIKDLHNDKFRKVMINSPYHICWTAMSEQDYSAALEGNQDRNKPVGEKENVYKVDHILHITEDDRGVPTGHLEKSGLIRYRFQGLEYPTFDKVTEIINDIDDAESDPEPVDTSTVTDYDVSIVKGNPRFINGDE